MKNLFLFLIFCSSAVQAQEIVIENFESGRLTWGEKTPLSKTNPEYKVVLENGNHYLHAAPEKGVEGKIIYKPFGIDLKKTPRLRWRWRAIELPLTGNEGLKGKNDSAAGVYVYMQKGITRRLLKYCFSAGRKEKDWLTSPGSSWFWTTKIKVLRTAAPLGTWLEETVDIVKDFKEAYGNDPPDRAEGIGVLTDGDQTNTTPKADYDDFVVLPPEGK